MDFEAFERQIALAGLKPTPDALQQMYAALPLLEAMRARIHADYDMAEEPAVIFGAALGLPELGR